ncbi:hypothetical protein bcgnr5380_62050 [Bacillus cereus]
MVSPRFPQTVIPAKAGIQRLQRDASPVCTNPHPHEPLAHPRTPPLCRFGNAR